MSRIGFFLWHVPHLGLCSEANDSSSAHTTSGSTLMKKSEAVDGMKIINIGAKWEYMYL